MNGPLTWPTPEAHDLQLFNFPGFFSPLPFALKGKTVLNVWLQALSLYLLQKFFTLLLALGGLQAGIFHMSSSFPSIVPAGVLIQIA